MFYAGCTLKMFRIDYECWSAVIVPTIKKREKLCIRVRLSFFLFRPLKIGVLNFFNLFFVFQAKSAITNSQRTRLSDIS